MINVLLFCKKHVSLQPNSSKTLKKDIMKVQEVLDNLKRKFPNEPEYIQAVGEVLESIEEVYNSYPEFEKNNLIERLCIPEQIGRASCRERV